MKVTFIVLLITLLVQVKLEAQSQISVSLLKRPACLEIPTRDGAGFTKELSDCIKNVDKKRSNTNWVIYIDQSDVLVYDKPNGKQSVTKLNFGEAYYVVDENSEWIRLLKINRNYQVSAKEKLQVLQDDLVGWVKKEQTLMWSNPLTDKYTSIPQKAFLSNRITMDPTKGGGKDSVILYKSPSEKSKLADIVRIHDFYFVFKVENIGVGAYYLLGKEPVLNSLNFESVLIGWAPKERVTLWDSRISFEPNYLPEAISERKRENCHVVALTSDRDCMNALSNCSSQGNGILMLDQSIGTQDRIAKETGIHDKSERLRFKGQIMRFPLIEYLNTNRGSILSTVAIGQLTLNSSINWIKDTIDSQTYSAFESTVIERVQSGNFVNVFFLVEGIPDHRIFRAEIESWVNELGTIKEKYPNIKTVRVGGAVYRDHIEKNSRIKDFELKRLASDKGPFLEFLNSSTAFAQVSDLDLLDGVPMFRAIKNSIELADFKKDQTNILVVLGRNRDVSDDRFKQWKKECPDCEVDQEQLLQRMLEYGVHVVGLSSERKRCAYESLQPLLSELNNRYAANLTEICKRFEREDENYRSWCEPFEEINRWNESGTWSVDRQFPSFSIEHIDLNRARGLAHTGFKKTTSILENQQEFFQNVLKIVVDGDASVSASAFNRVIFEDILKKVHGENKKQYHNIVSSLVFNRYKLATDAYIVHHRKGAKYAQLSPVIFYTQNEFNVASELLAEFLNTIDNSLKDKQAAFINLLKKKYALVTGYPVNSIGNDLTVNEIRERIHGLQRKTEGINLGSIWDISLGDIEKMNSEQFNEIYFKLKRTSEHLKNAKINYEFIYKSFGTSYYWIPAEDTF